MIVIFFFCLTYAEDYTKDFQNGLFRVDFPVKAVVMENKGVPSLKDIVSTAMAQWEEGIGVDIWELVEKEGILFIYWSFHFSRFDILGETRRTYRGGPLERMEIVLNGNNFFLTNGRDETLKWVLLHELGHSLGLAHSVKENDVMFPHPGTPFRLSEEDIKRGKKAVLFW